MWASAFLQSVVTEAGADHSPAQANLIAHWSGMVMAMMLPLAAPQAGWLARRSLAARRRRTLALHALAFLSPWAAAGVIAFFVAQAAHDLRLAPTIALTAAAAWHPSAPRRRLLTRCGSGLAPAILGWKADRDCLLAGWRAGLRCTLTCGPLMLPMLLSHQLLIAIPIVAVVVSERARGPNPESRAARPIHAGALAFLALITAA